MRTDQEIRQRIDAAQVFGARPPPRPANGSAGPPGSPRHEQLRPVLISAMDWSGAELNLVEGVIGHKMLALLYGRSGSAKSLIAIDLGLRVALGIEWHGREVRQGLAVYVAPEGGHSVHLRVHTWLAHHGQPRFDHPFVTIPASVDLCQSEADVVAIVDNIHELEPKMGKPVLVIVDTVSRALAGGNENAPDAMGAFVRNCDRLREALGATVLAVHHTPKGETGPRGHTSLKNACDVRLEARAIPTNLFALKVAHLKDGEAGAEFAFKLETEVVGQNAKGRDVEGALVVPAEVKPAGEAGRPKGRDLNERQLRVWQELTKREARTLSFAEFADACVASGAIERDNTGAHRKKAERVRNSLANKGLLTVDGKAQSVRITP